MNIRKFFIWCVVGGIAVTISFFGYAVIRSASGFLDPMKSLRILREYRTADSNTLFNKVKGFHLENDETAISVLVERGDPRIVDILLGFLSSRSHSRRKNALMALEVYIEKKQSDPRIINPVMNIVRSKKQKGVFDDEYRSALLLLSMMKYEEAWPYVVELVKAYDAPKSNLEPEMLKNFEKPEGLPLLRAMQGKNINDIYKRYIREAIQHLEMIEKKGGTPNSSGVED